MSMKPNYTGLVHWVNTTFPLGFNEGKKCSSITRTVDENAQFLVEKIKGRVRAEIESRRADRR